jgi:hypothetical protein
VAENLTNLHHIRSNEPDLLQKCPVHFVSQEVPTPGLEPMVRTGTKAEMPEAAVCQITYFTNKYSKCVLSLNITSCPAS